MGLKPLVLPTPGTVAHLAGAFVVAAHIGLFADETVPKLDRFEVTHRFSDRKNTEPARRSP